MNTKPVRFVAGAAMLLFGVVSVFSQTSSWVSLGPDNRLHYATDANGNRIMDFSYAGYEGGGVFLPNAPVRATVIPTGADDTAAIQSAIDKVSALPLDKKGFRGTVQLASGTFNVSSTLNINASGVILRGNGTGADGTTISMTGDPFLFLKIAGSGSWQTLGNAATITDSYVPSGANSFTVSDASGFAVGDTVLIRRPVTSQWIHLMGMDTLVRNGQPQTWISAGSTITTDRVISAINGNRITIDVPLSDNLDSQFTSPTTLSKYTFSGRISHVAAEGFAVIANPQNVDITEPQFNGLNMSAVINGWIRDVIFQDTQNTITVSSTVKQTTFDNVVVIHTKPHTGDGPADFALSGTQLFVNNSAVKKVCDFNADPNCNPQSTGTWAAVTQSRVTGPIVLLNFFGADRGFDPHQRWATGLLCDNCNFPNSHTADKAGIAYSNRGILGSGQGWDAGWSVAWNVNATYFLVQQPPGSQNFCIGCAGTILTEAQPGSSSPMVPNGIYDSFGVRVTPSSLYLEQLCERLGPDAVAKIGYGGSCATEDSQTETGTEATAPSI